MKTDAQEQQLQQQIREYLSVLGHGIWTIGLVAVAISLLAIVAITFLPNQYKATTTILVNPQRIPDRYVTSTVPADPSERLSTISQQVLSTTRLGEIIDQMHLYPEMRGKAREDVVELMRRHITLQVKQSSGQTLGSFTITYESSAPAAVAPVTNQLASSFINWNLKSREQRAEDTTDFMAMQLDIARQNLQSQEQKLRDFKMQHVGEMPDQTAANLQTVSRLQMAEQSASDSLNRLEQERQMLIRLPEPSQSVPSVQLSERGRLELEQQQLNYQLWELRKKYTDSHPDVLAAQARLRTVQAQISALPAAGPAAVTKEVSATAVRLDLIVKEQQRLLQEQRAIHAKIEGYQSKVDAVPLREQQLSDLTRDYEISKGTYSSLLDKTTSAKMATELERHQEGEGFTVLDAARPPEHPFKPNRLAMMLGSLVGSLACGAGLVLVREMLSGSIKAERELKSLLPQSVSFLGSIPSIETNADRSRRMKLRAVAVAVSLIGCMVVAIIVWKAHPIL